MSKQRHLPMYIVGTFFLSKITYYERRGRDVDVDGENDLFYERLQSSSIM